MNLYSIKTLFEKVLRVDLDFNQLKVLWVEVSFINKLIQILISQNECLLQVQINLLKSNKQSQAQFSSYNQKSKSKQVENKLLCQLLIFKNMLPLSLTQSWLLKISLEFKLQKTRSQIVWQTRLKFGNVLIWLKSEDLRVNFMEIWQTTQIWNVSEKLNLLKK